MTNLFAFGCSHTFGYALPDVVQYMDTHQGEIYPNKFGKNYNFGSKYSWTQILAQKLNLECKKVLKLLAAINFLQYF